MSSEVEIEINVVVAKNDVFFFGWNVSNILPTKNSQQRLGVFFSFFLLLFLFVRRKCNVLIRYSPNTIYIDFFRSLFLFLIWLRAVNTFYRVTLTSIWRVLYQLMRINCFLYASKWELFLGFFWCNIGDTSQIGNTTLQKKTWNLASTLLPKKFQTFRNNDTTHAVKALENAWQNRDEIFLVTTNKTIW